MMKQDEMKFWTPAGIQDTNEEGMLEQLNVNVGIALEADNEMYEASNEGGPEYEETFFYIVVNDEVFKFILGGPQVAGLDAFIETISEENGCELIW